MLIRKADHIPRTLGISVGILAAALLLDAPAQASICDATAFGCPSTGTCIITGTWEVDEGCSLAFGSQAVELRGTIKATTVGGSFAISAQQLALKGGKVKSQGNSTVPGGDITLTVEGEFRTYGDGPRVNSDGNSGGGNIVISAGSINLENGVIVADGGLGDSCGDAGRIELSAPGGALNSAILIRSSTAGNGCNGGSIALTGATVTVSGDLDAHGGAAASDDAIVIRALAGDLVVLPSAALDANGIGQSDGSGADGGNILLVAEAGNLLLSSTSVSTTGSSPDGFGGELRLVARDDVETSARVLVRSGIYGAGGNISIEAGDRAAITGDLLASGGSSSDGEGGSIEISAAGEVLIASTLDVSGPTGGSLNVANAFLTTIPGTVTARGTNGSGGAINVNGCTTEVTGSLDAGSTVNGFAGSVELSGGTVTIGAGGDIEALPCDPASSGCVELTAESALPTVHPTASVAPPPVSQIGSTGSPCPTL